MAKKVAVPVVALGGESGLGDKVAAMVRQVASNVTTETLQACGHFMIEERPDFIVRHVLDLASRTKLKEQNHG